MKVIMLAGGKGTRLPNSARDIPKPLVALGEKTILGYQLERLYRHGFNDIRLALNFRADQIVDYVKKENYPCEWVVEPKPLGTGGALRFATRDLEGPVLAVNADSLGNFNLQTIKASYERGKATIVAHWREDARDFGLLDIENGLVRQFREKPEEPAAGYINGGWYVVDTEELNDFSDSFFMLEKDLFPKLASEGRLKTHIHEGWWEDLGTEDRLQEFRRSFKPELFLHDPV